MKIYTIEDAYLEHLRLVDGKVPNSTGVGYTKAKPYLGVVLNVDGHDFLAPLSSPKTWHARVASSDLGMFKIHDRRDDTKYLGAIMLKFMVPAPQRVVTYLDFKSQTDDYRNLLQAQHEYIKTKWGKIQLRAEKLYDHVVLNPKPRWVDISCNFAELIMQSAKYP